MKHKIFILLTFIFISTILIGEEKIDSTSKCGSPDSLIPQNTGLIIKVPKISQAVDFLNSKNNYNLGNLLKNNIKWIKLLKDKTSIDLLAVKTLKDIGIDVEKAFYLTSYGYEKNEPDSIIFLPVTDKKKFPYNFIKFIKLINDNKNNLDLNPAVSMYKDVRVFQIPGKIFFAVLDNYFVLTSSGEALSSVIDMKKGGCVSSLTADQVYLDYKSKSEINNDIFNVFVKKEFLVRTLNAVQTKNAGKNNKDIQESKPDLGFLNYISFSLDSGTGELSFRSSISVNNDDPSGNLLIRVLITGLYKNAIFAENPSGYHFVSIDINGINEYFAKSADKNSSTYKAYARIAGMDNDEALLKDAVLPCSNSFINIIFQKPSVLGELDNFIFYVHMEDCGDIEKTLKKLKKELEKKYSGEDRFGEEKIDGHKLLWFKNGSNSKIYILEHKGNLYAGNNSGLIKNFLNSSDKHYPDIKNESIKRMGKNTFLFSYSQFNEESFFKAVLMMLAYNFNKDLYGFISKIDNVVLIGEKVDSDLMFNLRLKMSDSN